jgi:hypothetical protein
VGSTKQWAKEASLVGILVETGECHGSYSLLQKTRTFLIFRHPTNMPLQTLRPREVEQASDALHKRYLFFSFFSESVLVLLSFTSEDGTLREARFAFVESCILPW